MQTNGSSPHGRGTEQHPALPERDFRFIPAWAGNRPWDRPGSSRPTVHPRMGGEQRPSARWYAGSAGSSPHGRGTEKINRLKAEDGRFIPAWAGNSCTFPPGNIRLSVHPRMGGEQMRNNVTYGAENGSSPHGRGTDEEQRNIWCRERFIPAWAGNRRGRVFFPSPPTVHPRMGGEQAWDPGI